MMFKSLRSLLLIVQFLSLLSPLLGGWRRKKLSFLMKEGVLFALTNWDLIWKYLEKRQWSIETIKNVLRSIRLRK